MGLFVFNDSNWNNGFVIDFRRYEVVYIVRVIFFILGKGIGFSKKEFGIVIGDGRFLRGLGGLLGK